MPVKRQPVIWAADVDRVAHARTPKALRTLCGLVPVADRWSWPPERRCHVCTDIAANALPEGRPIA